ASIRSRQRDRNGAPLPPARASVRGARRVRDGRRNPQDSRQRTGTPDRSRDSPRDRRAGDPLARGPLAVTNQENTTMRPALGFTVLLATGLLAAPTLARAD